MERVHVLKKQFLYFRQEAAAQKEICLRAAGKPCWCQTVCRSDTWLSHLAFWGWGPLPWLCLRVWKGWWRAAFCCRAAAAPTGHFRMYLLKALLAAWLWVQQGGYQRKGVKEELLSDRILMLSNLHCLITLLQLLNVLRWMQSNQGCHFNKWSATKITNRVEHT